MLPEILVCFCLMEVERVPCSLAAAPKWETEPHNEAELEATHQLI